MSINLRRIITPVNRHGMVAGRKDQLYRIGAVAMAYDIIDVDVLEQTCRCRQPRI